MCTQLPAIWKKIKIQMNKRDLIFIDPTLKSPIGHSFEYHKNVIESMPNDWLKVDVYCNKSFHTKFEAPVSTNPIISYSPVETFNSWGSLKLIKKLYSWLIKTPIEIRRVLFKYRGRNKIFFFQHVEYFLLPSLIFGFLGQPAHAVVMLRSSPEDPNRYKAKIKGFLYRFLLGILRFQLGSRLKLVTDSKLLTQSFEVLLHQPVTTLPIPFDFNEPSHQPKRKSTRTISFLGRLDLDKGSRYIPELVKAISERDDCSEFIIHNYVHPDHAGSLSSLVNELNGLEKSFPNVSLIDSPVGSAEYRQTLASTDLMFFLYDQSRYRLQTSGLLVDALSAGIYPVVSDNTWLSYLVRDCGFGSQISILENVIERAVEAYDDFLDQEYSRRNRLSGKHGYAEFRSAFLDLTSASAVVNNNSGQE